MRFSAIELDLVSLFYKKATCPSSSEVVCKSSRWLTRPTC